MDWWAVTAMVWAAGFVVQRMAMRHKDRTIKALQATIEMQDKNRVFLHDEIEVRDERIESQSAQIKVMSNHISSGLLNWTPDIDPDPVPEGEYVITEEP